MNAYDALSVLFEAAAPAKGDAASSPGAVREASQVITLLALVRNTTQSPFQKLPQASAVFLAEAAVAALNPAAFLYAPINAFLLRSAALPQRGLSMFSQLHDGQARDWRGRRAFAQALALAAPQAAAPRMKLAAAAAAAPSDSAAARAFLRAAAASAALPASCVHMLRRGTLGHVAACAAASLSLLDRSALSEPAASSSDGAQSAHGENVLVALEVLRTAACVSQLWRGATRNEAVATFTCAIWSVLGALAGALAAAPHSCASVSGASWAAAVLHRLLRVLGTYLRGATAWHHSSARPSSFGLPFWKQLLDVAVCIGSPEQPVPGTGAEVTQTFAMIQQCLLCSSLAAISTQGDTGSHAAAHPCRDAQAYLQRLWGAAAAQSVRPHHEQQLCGPLHLSSEPHAVRLLAWIVAGACQKHINNMSDGHEGAALWHRLALAKTPWDRSCNGFVLRLAVISLHMFTTAGLVSLNMPPAVLEDVQSSMLQTLALHTAQPLSQWPCGRWPGLTSMLYRLALQMITSDLGDVDISSTSGHLDHSKLPPQVLRAFCGALGAVAAGKERLHDVMGQAVQVDRNSHSMISFSQDRHMVGAEGIRAPPVTMWSILHALACN